MSDTHTDKKTPRWIRPLPKQVVNKIAAGEVVERPAAVIKELVENAIDAGADRIEIQIEKSGGKLIKIVDNGCGIPAEQMELAFSRHATSKISEFADLDNLNSYGFRGEALPSIASVSRLRMVSRPQDADTGQEILFEGGILQTCQLISAPFGTTIEVHNLFFNTPARRKFLKSEATETRHISRIATALALGRPDIGFSYTNNQRKIYSVPAGETLGERVASILAPNQTFVKVDEPNELVSIKGFVGSPQMAVNNRLGLYLFINNRFIQSATLMHGVTSGYTELLPGGKFPVGVIQLTVDPGEVDVNVHPTKIEVRLAQEREIHDLIRRAVREALRRDGIIPLFKASSPVAGHDFGPSTHPNSSHTNNATIPGVLSRQPINTEFLGKLYDDLPQQTTSSTPATPMEREESVDSNTGEILESTKEQGMIGPSTGFRMIGRFIDLYLLIQAGDDLFIVDQHTAHERVLYEEMLVKVDRQAVNSQHLLFPVQVELSPEQLAVFEESADLFNESGFTVSDFGGRMVNIEAVPVILAKKSPEKLFLKIIDDFASLRKSGLDLKKAIAQSMACRAAVMSGDRLSEPEAIHLIKSLMQCENRYSCPHGRPTFIRLSREDLDKQFGRA